MEELVPKKNTHSPIWAFFGLKKDHEDNDETVIYAIILARGGNTTNLFSHLKIKNTLQLKNERKKRKSNKER